MRRLVLGILAGLSLIACDSDSPAAPGGTQARYFAPLNAASEVPPNQSTGVGQADFRLNTAGTELTYTLSSKSLTNIVQAHIHIAAEGVNGPIVQFLYGLVPSGGGPQIDGVLATGTITGAEFINLLAGKPLSDLVAAIESGNAYVNVHTNDGVGAGSGQPGDIPGGEIRGQIRKIQ